MVRSMTSGNPIGLILAFTVPLLIGNVFQQFYNIADIIIVGRTIGVNALAAVGAVAPVYMSVFGVTIGLSAGFSVIVGQRFGAKDMEGLRRSVATSTMLAFVITLMVTAGVSLAMPLILRVMNISGVLYDDAYHYMIIIVLGLMAMMAYNLLSSICRALGDSRTPLYFLIVSSLLNIALALLFIVVFGWGVPGSAIALVIAQGVSAVLCFVFMKKRFPMLRLTRSDWKFDWAFAWQHLRLGLPMAVQFLIISMGILILQSVCNTFGPETIAGFVSATKIEQLALQPMISFGIAMAVYSAQNYGAGKFDRIRMGVCQCSLVSLAFCAAAAVAMYFYGRNVIALFTTVHDDILMEQALLYLKMSVPFYIFLGQIFVYRNALQGMGISSVPLISSLLELSGRSVSALVLASMWGYFGICCASPICWVMAALFTGGSYYWVMHSMKNKRRCVIE